MKTPKKKYISYKIWNISKNKAPIGKRGYCFGEKAYMNPELWKTGVLLQML